ncbi:MAG: FAD:protein FMN transferase [Verrucomicrobia bacterium]|nr:FAD:protein FMN transferase [Verrucomicrobiota bacterium]MDA1065303.1 FAD:protein FMN transferase [Verrucomicrobiota bacterium]
MAEDVHSFRHQAMNTWIELSMTGVDPDYARKASVSAFNEVDRLERLLSRFCEGSDVDILNKRGHKEPVRVTEECWDCLLLAMDLEILTEGVFSIAFESFMDLAPYGGNRPIGTWLEMDPGSSSVFFKYPEITIDLGGIGKGHALDLVVKQLEDWDLKHFLLHSGTSSVVARGSKIPQEGWPVVVGADAFSKNTLLKNESLSSSSLAVQSFHILNLEKQEVLNSERRTWMWAPTGAVSDALSTSFMLMPSEQIKTICDCYPGLGALVLEPDVSEPLLFGLAKERCL